MINNLLNDFNESPLNTAANVTGAGIAVKLMDLSNKTLQATKQILQINEYNLKKQPNNVEILESILKTDKQILETLKETENILLKEWANGKETKPT